MGADDACAHLRAANRCATLDQQRKEAVITFTVVMPMDVWRRSRGKEIGRREWIGEATDGVESFAQQTYTKYNT